MVRAICSPFEYTLRMILFFHLHTQKFYLRDDTCKIQLLWQERKEKQRRDKYLCSTNMDFLAIPCKRTLHVDLLKNLGDLINKISLQNPSSFQNDLNFVDHLRDNILDTDLSDQSLADHVSYYYSVDILIKKFPSDQICFTWYQTLFTSSISSKQYSFQWDQVNVLYNIASLYSLKAIDLNVSNDGSYLTKQCKYFQLCAIILNFIITNYSCSTRAHSIIFSINLKQKI